MKKKAYISPAVECVVLDYENDTMGLDAVSGETEVKDAVSGGGTPVTKPEINEEDGEGGDLAKPGHLTPWNWED